MVSLHLVKGPEGGRRRSLGSSRQAGFNIKHRALDGIRCAVCAPCPHAKTSSTVCQRIKSGDKNHENRIAAAQMTRKEAELLDGLQLLAKNRPFQPRRCCIVFYCIILCMRQLGKGPKTAS